MNRTVVNSLVCGGALSVMTALALAQQPATQPPGQAPGAQRPGISGQRTAPGVTAQNMQAGQAVRLSQIIGSSVRSAQGRNLGQVTDVLVDPMTGRVDFAVLSLSGTAGTPGTPGTPSATDATTSGKLIPVPWQLFSRSFAGTGFSGARPGQQHQTLTLNIDDARLQNAPSFDANNWTQLQQGDFGQRAYAHFGLDWNRRGMTGAGTPGSGVTTGAGASGTTPRTDRGTGTETPRPGTTLPPGTTPPPGGTTPPPGGTTPPPGGTTPPPGAPK